MFFEILLLSVVVVTAYLGPMMLRRLPSGNKLYGWMLIVDLGLALVSFAARQDGQGDQTADLLGVIAIGGAVCLILVPPILRDLARRSLMRDRLKLALMLTDLRELLQPGLGARAEREVIEAILAVRSGKVEEAVETLVETKQHLENPMARRQIDERIVMTWLYARNWERAIEHYESHLGQPGPISPQLVVEMVRAYCETGELALAAELVESLEKSPLSSEPAVEPIWVFLVYRARLVFLAFVGRTTAVDAILAPTGPLGAMPPAARQFWSGIARMNAGDRTGARTSFESAAKLSGRDRRARELAERSLSSLDEPGTMGPHPVPPPAAELADRLTAIATSAEVAKARPKQAPKLVGVGMRQVPVTVGLVAVNLVVSVLVAVLLGSTSDVGALVLAGANLGSAVSAGEYWRLPASMFLHVGILHLVLNMYGLWILGRLVEQMVGSVRYFAIYMTAGLLASVASYATGVGVSAGASGAVFGVLGAAMVELALHGKAYPRQWRGSLLRNLIFLTVANVLIGFYYPAIDQAAHLGGLVAGGAVTAVLSRQNRLAGAPIVRSVALVLAIIGGVSIAYAAFGVSTTRYSDTLAKYQWVEAESSELRWEQPAAWLGQSAEVDFRGVYLEGGDLEAVLDALVRRDSGDARSDGMKLEPADRDRLVLPDGWKGREMMTTVDNVSGASKIRFVFFGRQAGPGASWLGAIQIPEVLVGDSQAVFTRIIESVERKSGP